MSDSGDCNCDQALALKGQLLEANHRCNIAWRDLEDCRKALLDARIHIQLLRKQLGEKL